MMLSANIIAVREAPAMWQSSLITLDYLALLEMTADVRF